MTTRKYSASLSRSQGRAGYSIIFRHPVRQGVATGKSGIRVRRGLGTRDKEEAERLRDELNELLGEPKYYDPAARPEAEGRFDARVVDIFYDKMLPEAFDCSALRDAVIPLPPGGEPDGYRHVFLLGTTGAGKTTLVRQLIGTDPAANERRRRFPSTSTAKTTIHDIEIILDNDSAWRAVVTFVSSDEARESLNECISEAVRAIARDADIDDATVLRHILNHVEQRFRFNYILGNGPKNKTTTFDFDDEDEEEDPRTDAGAPSDEESGSVNMASTNELLARVVGQLRELTKQLRDQLHSEPDTNSEEDKSTTGERSEAKLDNLLRRDETFHEIADALMDEIEKRFDLLPPGQVSKNRQGWPLTWQEEWPKEKRGEFLESISRFSSNYAPLYGRLLTPLVNGVRVAGPFAPKWANGHIPKLVLLDGEGLGHTLKSSSSVSTKVSRRIEAADAVLLVDNATQPMQAAPVSAMREIVTSGNGRKLILAFTHFDEVKGDNLPKVEDKVNHVLASAENVLAALGADLHPNAERILRKRIEESRFFLADLQEPLSKGSPAGRRTVGQLQKLLRTIDQVIEKPQPTKACPVYDRMRLANDVLDAAKGFRETWRPLLGLETKPGFAKEHWARIKALSRRLAVMGKDEYKYLRPVADLRQELKDRFYVFIQNPLSWKGLDSSEEEKQVVLDTLADNLGKRFLDLSTRRIWQEHSSEWIRAYKQSGRGSTVDRAKIIGNEIYDPAAPTPDNVPLPDRNQFLREVVKEFEDAAKEVEKQLQ